MSKEENPVEKKKGAKGTEKKDLKKEIDEEIYRGAIGMSLYQYYQGDTSKNPGYFYVWGGLRGGRTVHDYEFEISKFREVEKEIKESSGNFKISLDKLYGLIGMKRVRVSKDTEHLLQRDLDRVLRLRDEVSILEGKAERHIDELVYMIKEAVRRKIK